MEVAVTMTRRARLDFQSYTFSGLSWLIKLHNHNLNYAKNDRENRAREDEEVILFNVTLTEFRVIWNFCEVRTFLYRKERVRNNSCHGKVSRWIIYKLIATFRRFAMSLNDDVIFLLLFSLPSFAVLFLILRMYLFFL